MIIAPHDTFRPLMQVSNIKQGVFAYVYRWRACNSQDSPLHNWIICFQCWILCFQFWDPLFSSLVDSVGQLSSFIWMVITQFLPTHFHVNTIWVWVIGNLYLIGNTMVSCRPPLNHSSECVKKVLGSPHQRIDVQSTWPKCSDSTAKKLAI